MASIFSKNGILSGRIDFYCLICDEQFRNADETLAHIANTRHKVDLKTCAYFEKYEEDFIRKINGVYFCEPCSLTFPTATKVDLHLSEPSHITAKKNISPWLERMENDVILFNQFIISDDAWNGFVEDTCVLCNEEFDDSSSHKAIKSHVLNLIKSEVIFDDDEKTVYRMIDNKSHQCLTCNVIFGNVPTSHFKTVEHKDAYKSYDPSIYNKEPKITTTSNNIDTKKESQHVKDSIKEVNGNNTKNADKDIKTATKSANGDNTKSADKKAVNDIKTATKSASGNTKTADKCTKTATKSANGDNTKTPEEKEKLTQKSKQSARNGLTSPEELDKIYCKNVGARNYITEIGSAKLCILCERLIDESPEEHIRSKSHQYLVKLHRERLAEDYRSSQDEGTIPYESVEEYQKNVNIDFINETAFCKKCSKNVDFNTNAIEKHIEDHMHTRNKKPPATLSSGIKSNGTEKTTLYTKPVLLGKAKQSKTVSVGEYAKQHGFTHNRADVSFYCHPCTRRLHATLEDLQKHVASKIHTENTKAVAKIDTNVIPVKEPIMRYIKSFEFVNMMGESVVIINGKYWMNGFGFFLIAKKIKTIFCHGCHIDLTERNVLQHVIGNQNHKDLFEKTFVITSLEGEFIREIRKDLYLCGYCNSQFYDWDDVLDHITSSEHQRKKSKAEEFLRKHRPDYFSRVRSSKKELEDMFKFFGLHAGN